MLTSSRGKSGQRLPRYRSRSVTGPSPTNQEPSPTASQTWRPPPVLTDVLSGSTSGHSKAAESQSTLPSGDDNASKVPLSYYDLSSTQERRAQTVTQAAACPEPHPVQRRNTGPVGSQVSLWAPATDGLLSHMTSNVSNPFQSQVCRLRHYCA